MQISAKVLVVLVGLLMVSLMVVAYLLGRDSSRRGAVPPSMALQVSPPATEPYSAVIPTSFPEQVAPYTPPPYNPPPYTMATPVKVLPRFDQSPGVVDMPPALPGGGYRTQRPHLSQQGQQSQGQQLQQGQQQGQGDQNSSAREAVEAYFVQVDQIAQAAKSWDDPNAMAQECLKAAMAGDTSGLDRLISSYQTVQQGIGAITPPADCTEHKRRTIEVLSKSVGVLESIKRGITSGDMSALSSLQFDAQSIKEKGESVEQMTLKIKNRYGIK